MKEKCLEDKMRRADATLIAFRLKRLVPRLDDAVSRGDLGAIHEVRDLMKEALKPLPAQIGGATPMARRDA